MKIILIAAVLLSTVPAFSTELKDMESPSIYIHLNTENRELTDVGMKLLNDLKSRLSSRLPCARITTMADMVTAIREDRAKSLADKNYESNLPEIGKMMLNPFYLISVKAYKLGRGYSLGGRFTYNRCKSMLSDPISEKEVFADDPSELAASYADALAADLLAMDICPYKGDLSHEVTYRFGDYR